MSLHEFLRQNQKEILVLSEQKTMELAALRPVSDELRRGLPIFYKNLVAVLRKNKALVSLGDEKIILSSAGEHGKEFLRLGYTLSHVVHAYGAICQAITQIASTTKAAVTALEFHNLNRCLDIAIAGAVTEFEAARNIQTKSREVEHMGHLAHELRNALHRATIASEMMSKGIVGVAGSTARVLQHSLAEMQILLDRSLSEIKLRAKSQIDEERFSIMEIVDQLIVTAEIEASSRGQTISVQVEPELEVKTDRLLLQSALGNLVQNALKYSCANGNIQIIARTDKGQVILEVKDQCGGLDPKKIEVMFAPFSRLNTDKSGLGLGLTISRQAIDRCGGTLIAENISGGCVFRITLPKADTVPVPSPTVV